MVDVRRRAAAVKVDRALRAEVDHHLREFGHRQPCVDPGAAAVARHGDQLAVADAERCARMAFRRDVGVELLGARREALVVRIRIERHRAAGHEQRPGLQEVACGLRGRLGARADLHPAVRDDDARPPLRVRVGHPLVRSLASVGPDVPERAVRVAHEEPADDRLVHAGRPAPHVEALGLGEEHDTCARRGVPRRVDRGHETVPELVAPEQIRDGAHAPVTVPGLTAGQLLYSISDLLIRAQASRPTLGRMKSVSRAGTFMVGLVLGVAGLVMVALLQGHHNSATKTTPTKLTSLKTTSTTDPDAAKRVYAEAKDSVAYISATQAQGQATGSGFVVSSDGKIITNEHVVDGAQQVTVKLGTSGTELPAQVLAADASKDLALLQVDASGKSAAPADPRRLVQASRSATPSSRSATPTGSTTRSRAASCRRWTASIQSPDGTPIEGAIQTDAAINPGNSGGALLDENGDVIGVNSQIASASSSGGESGNVGIGFAIASNTVKDYVAHPTSTQSQQQTAPQQDPYGQSDPYGQQDPSTASPIRTASPIPARPIPTARARRPPTAACSSSPSGATPRTRAASAFRPRRQGRRGRRAACRSPRPAAAPGLRRCRP